MALHEAMSVRVECGELPGIVTLVARGDDVSVDAIGVTAFGGDVPMRRDTMFRIASMTKPVMAAAAMILAEDGLIDLHGPVAEVLPEVADQRVLARLDGPLEETVPLGRPMTVEDLLTFRMGFGMITEPSMDPDWPIVRAWRRRDLAMAEPDPRTPHDPDTWIQLFGELPLMYQPGTHWQYNAGTLVLGVLLARASGTSLDDLLRLRVFEPLGMRDTGFWLAPDRAAALPAQYVQAQENSRTGVETWSRPPAFPSGSSGLVSTADDLLAFGRMLLRGGWHRETRVLSEASVEHMTHNQLTPAQIATAGILLDGHGWGLGMAVTVEEDEISRPGRYGWSGGYGTTWFNDPTEGLVAIALTQVSDFLWSGALTEFEKLAYE